MYREEYSWWTLVIAFETSDEQYKELCAYEFDGTDDLGIRITRSGKRAIVEIHCVVEAGPYWDGGEYDDDEDNDGATVVTNDYILDALVQVRKQVMSGDYRALYAVWEVYGNPDDTGEEDEAPPKPKNKKSGAKIVNDFKDMLTTV